MTEQVGAQVFCVLQVDMMMLFNNVQGFRIVWADSGHGSTGGRASHGSQGVSSLYNNRHFVLMWENELAFTYFWEIPLKPLKITAT